MIIENGVLKSVSPDVDFPKGICIIPKGVKIVGARVFKNCTTLLKVELPYTLKHIRTRSFYGCSNLLSILIPDNVETIGASAFSKCTNLRSIRFGNNLYTINFGAFSNCTSLLSINLPKNLTKLERCAFFNCSSLTSVTFYPGIKLIDYLTFGDCNKLSSINGCPCKKVRQGFNIITDKVITGEKIIYTGYDLNHFYSDNKTILYIAEQQNICEKGYSLSHAIKCLDNTLRHVNIVCNTNISPYELISLTEYFEITRCSSLYNPSWIKELNLNTENLYVIADLIILLKEVDPYGIECLSKRLNKKILNYLQIYKIL